VIDGSIAAAASAGAGRLKREVLLVRGLSSFGCVIIAFLDGNIRGFSAQAILVKLAGNLK